MNNVTTTSLQMPEDAVKDVLAEILRDGQSFLNGMALLWHSNMPSIVIVM